MYVQRTDKDCSLKMLILTDDVLEKVFFYSYSLQNI